MIFCSLLAIISSFIITFKTIPFWISRIKKARITGKDIHKLDRREVAELGGLPVVCGFISGLLIYIVFKVFIYNSNHTISIIFAIITTILIATIIGLIDDILGWKTGLRQRHKVISSTMIALPMIVINAGTSTMNIPLLGKISLGLIYPLIMIPIAMIGTSNAFNMIAGFNGLEAGMGIIIISTLSIISYKTNTTWLAFIGLCMIASLLAFLYYNKYPAKIFPGDTLTYSVGTMVGIMAIMGNIEKFAIILFVPYFIEFILKARGKMKKESFGKTLKDGSIVNKYKKWYGIEHMVISFWQKIKGKVYENDIVFSIWGIELMFAIGIILYYFI